MLIDLMRCGLLSYEDAFAQFYTLLVENRASTPNLRMIPMKVGKFKGGPVVRGTSRKVQPADMSVVRGIEEGCKTESIGRSESDQRRWSFLAKDGQNDQKGTPENRPTETEMVETKMPSVAENVEV